MFGVLFLYLYIGVLMCLSGYIELFLNRVIMKNEETPLWVPLVNIVLWPFYIIGLIAGIVYFVLYLPVSKLYAVFVNKYKES